MSMSIINILNRYNHLREKFSQDEWTQFLERILVVHAGYSNTSIEGTDVTLEDVYDMFAGSQLPSNRAADEQEVRNYVSALRMVTKKSITTGLILETNRIILHEVYDEIAGVYRKVSYGNMAHLLSQIVEKYSLKSIVDIETIFNNAVAFHLEFERLHPFMEGNGRTGRVVFSNMMEHIGLPSLVFSINHGRMYFVAIRNNDQERLKHFFIKCYEHLLELMEFVEEYY